MPEMTEFSTLLSHPVELIQSISDELDIPDVCRLRLTCKELTAHLGPQLFHTFTLDISRSTIAKVIPRLEALSRGDHVVCYSAKKLVIRSLSPSHNQDLYGTICSLTRTRPSNRLGQSESSEESYDVARAKEFMMAHLFDAIASLKNVRNVEWSPSSTDKAWSHQTVMNALSSLPTLNRISIRLSDVKIALDLQFLKYLHEVNLDGVTLLRQGDIFESLAKAIAQNQCLTSITLSRSWRQPFGGTLNQQNLHQLFKYYPATAPPLRLRHLSLRSFLVRLDSITLHHLSHLTSLSLTCIEDPDVPVVATFPTGVQDDSLVHERSKYGSTLDDIWKALINAGIHLVEITVDVVPSALLDYLALYTGLKILRLMPGGFHGGGSSDTAADQFFSVALKYHVQTLEDLQIASLFEGRWCFGSHNVDVISQCTKLRKLRMCINSDQLPSQQPHSIEEANDMKLLLDTVVLHMPRISIVLIAGANQEALRPSRSGYISMVHFAAVNRKLSKIIDEYEPPPSCHRLPLLMVSSSGKLVYQCKTKQNIGTYSNNEAGLKESRGLKYVKAPVFTSVNDTYSEWL
ncbi:hypothetical protein JR316_0012455 [Psilocybe cubensis]|uniref:F-box domain-containing protein n=2 Tax=Psilocybe cubensis TaxID=181762 RepID=A0A8H8CFV7_PSICU|nr:hypothetical protein JR316_0012455 [Psilocybe cubensis]KAH9475344.1 hypothetical protein JR316_0012455 [Psilocybe cubensis]